MLLTEIIVGLCLIKNDLFITVFTLSKEALVLTKYRGDYVSRFLANNLNLILLQHEKRWIRVDLNGLVEHYRRIKELR